MINNLLLRFDRLLWRIPDRMPGHHETRRIDAGNCLVRVRDTGGSKPALVFLCDPPVTVEAYDDVIASFGSAYRILIVELPGFGFSKTRADQALSFEGVVSGVEAALASLDLDKCILFGPCICGFVAAELARRRRLPVKGVVLLQTPDKDGMAAWVDGMDSKRILRTAFLGQLVVRLNAGKFIKTWLKVASARSFDASRIVQKVDTAFKNGAGYPLATTFQQWPGRLSNAKLDIPGLAIWGKQDRTHRNTDINSTCEHIPRGNILEFGNCGHFTELEDSAAFAAAVRPFIHACLD